MKKYLLVIAGSFLFCVCTEVRAGVIVDYEQNSWVDSVMNTLTLRQRIAQLFMIAVMPNVNDRYFQKALDVVATEQVGGIIAMQGDAYRWVSMVNCLQSISKVPLLTAIDGEYGVSMRFDSVKMFPRQMPLGALTDNTCIYDMGKMIARQCRRLGIVMNFAPVVDINSNPANPVINIRSFGEDKVAVAEKGIACMRGMQEGGILTCAKHFPGHGDTDTDSHYEIPLLFHTKERLYDLDLYPFMALIKNGVDATMVGHLQVMSIDTVFPASLSQSVTEKLLREEMAFNGLIFTDALNMKGVALSYPKSSLGLMALQAGSDVVLMPEDITPSINLIENAVKKGTLLEQTINTKCRRVLAAKYKAELNHYTPVDTTNLYADLNSLEDEILRLRIAEASVTLLVNNNDLIPLKRLDTLNIAYLEVGEGKGTVFGKFLKNYTEINCFSSASVTSAETLDSLYKALNTYNLLIVGYHSTDARPQYSFGVDSLLVAFLQHICKNKKIILNYFGIPYALKHFDPIETYDGVIVSYQNTPQQQQHAAQLIFGGIVPQAKLPVSINDKFPAGSGLSFPAPVRLKYVLPEETGIRSQQLLKIDSLMQEAIDKRATPGGQIIAAYKGQVFYNKTFGRHTYDTASPPVLHDDLYDLASLTKVSATLPVTMYMVDKGRLRLWSKLGDYIALDKFEDKQNLHIADILAHQSGLQAYEPFHEAFLKNGDLVTDYFSTAYSATFPIQVANHIYASPKVKDYIYARMNRSPLKSKTYRYSDWGFMYIQWAIENLTGKKLDNLSDSLFFAPLGMNNTSFLPLTTVDQQQIIPTEQDDGFRRQLLQGYVHDQTAALSGGVSGHAGLFGNANDLAKLLQMYLNKGEYGGERYIDSNVVKTFTQCPFCDKGNRRGLGFDKPEPNPTKQSPVGRDASMQSFGHSGYTGTFWWVDPQRNLIYVFLSNRIYPDDNKKLNNLNTRTKILSAFTKIIDELPNE